MFQYKYKSINIYHIQIFQTQFSTILLINAVIYLLLFIFSIFYCPRFIPKNCWITAVTNHLLCRIALFFHQLFTHLCNTRLNLTTLKTLLVLWQTMAFTTFIFSVSITRPVNIIKSHLSGGINRGTNQWFRNTQLVMKQEGVYANVVSCSLWRQLVSAERVGTVVGKSVD